MPVTLRQDLKTFKASDIHLSYKLPLVRSWVKQVFGMD